MRCRRERMATMLHWLSATAAVLLLVLPQGGGNFGSYQYHRLPRDIPAYIILTAGKSMFPPYDLMYNYSVASQRARNRSGTSQVCEGLELQPRQTRMCKRDSGVALALLNAARLSVTECLYRFQRDRWNCSLGPSRSHILKRAFKETAYLHAVTSASLVHSFARACSSSQLDRCTCDMHYLKGKNEAIEAWLWGGCDDNVNFGAKFTKRFIQAKKWNKDAKAKVDQHNSNVGVKVVRSAIKTRCKCHGISGSCVTKICWRVSVFYRVGEILKHRYKRAKKVAISQNKSTRKVLLVLKATKTGVIPKKPKQTDLLYIEKPPSFCDKHQFSTGTQGRQCGLGESCDTLCCGRGYNTIPLVRNVTCHCRVKWCCEVICEKCLNKTTIYTCK